jgi:hypothetical protein
MKTTYGKRIGMICMALLMSIQLCYAVAGVKEVNCNTGKTIADVLARAEPGDTIRIVGTCNERLTVTTDRLTLDGQGLAVLNGGGSTGGSFAGVIVIDGARGVLIKGLTLQHGPNGIVAKGGAAFKVRDSIFQNNAGSAIQIGGGSTAELMNCTMNQNGTGMNVLNGSSVIVEGTVSANNNAGNGIFVGAESVMEIRGAMIQASNNMLSGLVIDGGHAVAWGFPESQGSKLTADGNGTAGIGIANGVLLYNEGGGGAGFNTISATHNGLFGIFLPIGGTIDSPFGSSKFTVSNNPIGLFFGIGSSAIIHGGLVVQNSNIAGVLADGAGTINVNAAPLPIPPNPSTITGNGIDVDLRFGSRAIFGNALTIGTVKCDNTILSRGSTACP